MSKTCPHCGKALNTCERCGTTQGVRPLQWASGQTTYICQPCLDGLEQVVGYYMDSRPDLNRVDADIPDYPPQP